MSSEEKAKKNNDNIANSTIIEEKVGNTDVLFSKVFELYEKNILLGAGEKRNLFGASDIINLNEDEKNKFKIEGNLLELTYNNEIVYDPITITFEKNYKKNTYKIYTKSFFNKIFDEMNFKSPLLLIDNKYLKFEKEKNSLFTSLDDYNNLKISEFDEDYYEEYYCNKKNSIFSVYETYKPSEFSNNFELYFSSPKKQCYMKFVITTQRYKKILGLKDFTNKKINSIFGPYGNGKTTTLIILSKLEKNVCYLNLKALYKNKNNINIWKYKILLFELYNLFQNQKDIFNDLKENINAYVNFWDAIRASIEFCKKKKINSIFILDQFKEDIDPKFFEYKKIKSLINDKKNNYVKLIVSSSINNLDIRDFIIKKYIDRDIDIDIDIYNNEQDKQKIKDEDKDIQEKDENKDIKEKDEGLIIDYHYIQTLFQIDDIKDMLNLLTDIQKKIFEENFSNIPIYFYAIYDSSDDEINQTLAKIKKDISQDIENFYKKNILSLENMSFIIHNYHKIGLNKIGGSKLNKEETKKFFKILPIKYFIFDINSNNEIENLSFYFKFAKSIFLDIILKKNFELLENPGFKLPERTLGDLLELIIIEHFKNNSVEKFDQICKVNSIWEMKEINRLDKNRVNNNNIFITQDIDVAKNVDFGILLKGETLILVQCKKCLKVKPSEYITIKKIILHKNKLYESFIQCFGCRIKKIKLFYITGILFLDEEKTKYHSWSGDNISLSKLEEITKSENIPLVLFDVKNKKTYIHDYKNEPNFQECTILNDYSLINDENNYKFVEIKPENDNILSLIKSINSEHEKQKWDLINNAIIEEKSKTSLEEEFFEKYFKDRELKIKKKKKIVIHNNNIFSLNNDDENYLTTFKINDEDCFCYYDPEKKKTVYKQINKKKETVNDLEFKNIEITFLEKKRK